MIVKRLVPILILVLAMAAFGCNAQKKPVPQEKIIPQESTIGFHTVDLEQAPTQVKRILSSMSNREMVAWASAADNNYIIISPETDETIKVDKVVQRVPGENFLWLDVRLVEMDNQDDKDGRNDKKNKDTTSPVIIKLDRIDKSINGVGFEIRDEEDGDDAPAPKTPETSTPAPAAPVIPAPEKKPAPAKEPAPKPETPQPRESQQQQQQEQEQKQQQPEQEEQTEKEEPKP